MMFLNITRIQTFHCIHIHGFHYSRLMPLFLSLIHLEIDASLTNNSLLLAQLPKRDRCVIMCDLCPHTVHTYDTYYVSSYSSQIPQALPHYRLLVATYLASSHHDTCVLIQIILLIYTTSTPSPPPAVPPLPLPAAPTPAPARLFHADIAACPGSHRCRQTRPTRAARPLGACAQRAAQHRAASI